MKLSNLKGAAYNPRKISDEALSGLKYSLNEFGDISGIVFNERTGHLVAGHQRIKALIAEYGDLVIDTKENWVVKTPHGQTFPVRRVDWPIEKEKAANVAANSPTIAGEFTDDLGPLLDEIKLDLPDDFESLRFEELQDLEVGEENEPMEDAEAPLPPAVPIVKPGDLFRLGKHRLLCGDSTKKEHASLLLSNEEPVLMVTDPPYGVNYDPEWREKWGLGPIKSRGKVVGDDRIDWSETYRLSRANVIYVWHAGKHSHVVAQNIVDCGYEIVSQIIWNKPHLLISRGDYHWKHEPCWYAVKKGHTHNWHGDRTQTTVWDIANNSGIENKDNEKTYGHGTQKPLECMARPIRNNSKKGDLIYDPFLGSGTTLVAADKLNRKCYGMEIDPAYCEVIIRRWAENCSDENGDVDFEHVNGKLTIDEIVANVNGK
jgi:DNA modification methylase